MEKTVLIPMPGRLPVHKIIEAVCARHGLTRSQLTQRCRQRYIAHPRQQAMWLIDRFRPEVSFNTIARVLGLTDHTTVIHGLDAVQDRIEVDPDELQDITAICYSLGKDVPEGPRKSRLTPEEIARRSLMGIKSAALARRRRWEESTAGLLDTAKPVLHGSLAGGASAGDAR